MKKTHRILLIALALCLCLPLFSSCNSAPKYEENLTYTPSIICDGTEYKLDQINKYVSKESSVISADSNQENYFPVTFEVVEEKTRLHEKGIIVTGTVIDASVQSEIYPLSDFSAATSSELICPFRIDEILYSSENADVQVGEIIELYFKGDYFLAQDDDGEVCWYSLRRDNTPYISGGEYLLYLTYPEEQPEYDIDRYTLCYNGKFELTDYAKQFEKEGENVFTYTPDYWQTVFRKYGKFKDGMYVHDTAKYPETPSLASVDDVKEIGIRFGNKVVDGYKYAADGVRCKEYSASEQKYIYEYFSDYKEGYEDNEFGYDLTSGIIPEGCPIIVWEYGEDTSIIDNHGYKNVVGGEMFEMNGDEIQGAPENTGMYWLRVFATDPEEEVLPAEPKVGEEYVTAYAYLFVVIVK